MHSATTRMRIAVRSHRQDRFAASVLPARAIIRAAACGALFMTVMALAATAAEAAPADPVRERGVVTRVVDGDTVMVRPDGRSSDISVRLSAIQAFERGECGDDIATRRLRELVEGKRVDLRARSASARSDGRPVRSLHLPRAGGGSIDVNRQLLSDGMGLWFPLAGEITSMDSYAVAAHHARVQRRGIWNDQLCGAGPQAGHPIDMWVKSDADGNDRDNINDEYVVVVNRHQSTSLDLSRWVLRDSSHFTYRIPSGTRIDPGARMRFRVGRGTDNATNRYMGSGSPIFDNADRATGVGDGAYLLDTRGNVRKAFVYPCVVECSSSLAGSLRIDHIEYDPPGVDTADTEFIRLRNVGQKRIHLDGYQLRKWPYGHEFRANTFLDPGERLTVTVGKGSATRTQQYWGKSSPILRNSGDVVEILSWDYRPVHCRAWGDRRCPNRSSVPGTGTSSMPTHGFADVPSNAYYDGAVRWLRARGITDGVGSTGLYRPADHVTRGQMAAFLWRAMDRPAVNASHGFPDVLRSDFYDGGVRWLRSAEITDGVGNTGLYQPNARVTRAQMAAFLWRMVGRPTGYADHGFPDVPGGAYYDEAVRWLKAEGITDGVGNTGRYEPNDPVTRAQMAAFLHRLSGSRSAWRDAPQVPSTVRFG